MRVILVISLKLIEKIVIKKTKNFLSYQETKIYNPNKFTPYMNENKSNTYTQTKNLFRKKSVEEKYLMHYRLLKINSRYGTVVDKIFEIFSLKQNN